MMHARPLNWAERHVGAQNAFYTHRLLNNLLISPYQPPRILRVYIIAVLELASRDAACTPCKQPGPPCIQLMRQSVKPVDNTFGYLGLNWRFAAYLPAQSYGRVQTIPTIV